MAAAVSPRPFNMEFLPEAGAIGAVCTFALLVVRELTSVIRARNGESSKKSRQSIPPNWNQIAQQLDRISEGCGWARQRDVDELQEIARGHSHQLDQIGVSIQLLHQSVDRLTQELAALHEERGPKH